MAGLAIAAGTYAGGWRIIRTMGRGLTDIQSPQGFAAETASGIVVICVAAVAVTVGIYAISRRDPVDAGNVNDRPMAPVLSTTTA